MNLDDKLNWSANAGALYKKGQSRFFFLRKLRSFDVCKEMLLMFYQSVMASVLFYAAVCWGGNMSKRDTGRLDKLVRKAGSVVGQSLGTHWGLWWRNGCGESSWPSWAMSITPSTMSW